MPVSLFCDNKTLITNYNASMNTMPVTLGTQRVYVRYK